MKTLIILLALSVSTTAMADYKLSLKDIKIATANIEQYYGKSTGIKYLGKKTLLVSVNSNECEIKNVTFMRDYKGTKMIDEKTYNKLEECAE